jgi:hypothetical protein
MIARDMGFHGGRKPGEIELSLRRSWKLIQRGRIELDPAHPAWSTRELEAQTLLLIRHIQALRAAKSADSDSRLRAIIAAVDALG